MAGPWDEKEPHRELLSPHAQRQQIIGFWWGKEEGWDSPRRGSAISLEPVDFQNLGRTGKATCTECSGTFRTLPSLHPASSQISLGWIPHSVTYGWVTLASHLPSIAVSFPFYRMGMLLIPISVCSFVRLKWDNSCQALRTVPGT